MRGTSLKERKAVERAYSVRRYVYAFGVTVFVILFDAFLVLMQYESTLAQLFVKASMELVGAIALYYLCAGLIDRSRILDRIGDRFSGPGASNNEYRSRVVREETVSMPDDEPEGRPAARPKRRVG